MSEAKHTPTPWRVRVNDYSGDVSIVSADESKPPLMSVPHHCPLCKFSHAGSLPADANADFIVTAVNAHDDLLAACQALREGLDDHYATTPEGIEAIRLHDLAVARAGGAQ